MLSSPLFRCVRLRCALRSAAAFLLVSALAAAAPSTAALAIWEHGPGTIAAAPAASGAALSASASFVVGAQPARLALVDAPGSRLHFARGSSGRFTVHNSPKGQIAVLDLDTGAVQVDIPHRGTYAEILVRGAALQVRVTGTLFLVERVRKDADYTALVRGTVKVSLREEIAVRLGRKAGEEVELAPRQGLGGDTTGGLGGSEVLASRPQIAASSSLREQGQTPDPSGTSWTVDVTELGTGTGSQTPSLSVDPIVPTGSGIIDTAVVDTVTTTITSSVVQTVVDAVVVDVVQTTTQAVVTSVVQTVISDLAAPPNPP